MPAQVKPNQIRIRISAEDTAIISALAEDSGLSLTDVATAMLHGAAKAVRDNHGRMPIPLLFHIIEPQPQIMRAEERPAAPKLTPARK